MIAFQARLVWTKRIARSEYCCGSRKIADMPCAIPSGVGSTMTAAFAASNSEAITQKTDTTLGIPYAKASTRPRLCDSRRRQSHRPRRPQTSNYSYVRSGSGRSYHRVGDQPNLRRRPGSVAESNRQDARPKHRDKLVPDAARRDYPEDPSN